ncbi:MAG: hypothetical protein ACYSWU_21815 [Planctomycetota bacterium]
MTEEYPYTGEDIDRVTGGYVNSGVLRMWVSEGWLTPGARAKSIRGGPRTFDRKTIFKAVFMAEMRKCGVSLSTCGKWADDLVKAALAKRRDTPVYYVIKPDSDTVFPIFSTLDSPSSLDEIAFDYGPTFLIIHILGLIKSTSAILDDYGPVDQSEEIDHGRAGEGA